MPRRLWMILILILLILVGLAATFHRDLMWSGRFLLFEKQQAARSTRALPTCLGCAVQVIFVDGDFKLEKLLLSDGPQAKSFLKKAFLFTRAYTNSLDPVQGRDSLFNLKYPTEGYSPKTEEPIALKELLKAQGYTLEMRQWSLRQAEDFERQWHPSPNSLVILTSLNGLDDHESLRKAKDSAIRIPLFIYHSDAKDPGRIEDLISLVDLGPMLLNLLGAPEPAFAQGRSLMAPEPGRPVYGRGPEMEYAFDGEWKLIRKTGGEIHVFYLPLDPDEKDDLAGLSNPWVTKAVVRLSTEAERWHRAAGGSP